MPTSTMLTFCSADCFLSQAFTFRPSDFGGKDIGLQDWRFVDKDIGWAARYDDMRFDRDVKRA